MGRRSWVDLFDERQQKEIDFTKVYIEHYNHGTDGHNAKVIIAKMAQLLDQIEVAVGSSTGDSGLALKIESILHMTKKG